MLQALAMLQALEVGAPSSVDRPGFREETLIQVLDERGIAARQGGGRDLVGE